MPSTQWSKLSPLQLGRYAEYYTKMEFASYGFEIYTSEVDDHGVDFVAKLPGTSAFYEVQVKSVRKTAYVYIPKSKMQLSPNMLVCYLRFEDGSLPKLYVIPATVWQNPNAVFNDRDYAGKKSAPEWGISYSRKHKGLLEPYAAEEYFKTLLK